MHLLSDLRVQSIPAIGLTSCNLPEFGLLLACSWLASIYLPFAIRRCRRARAVTFPVSISHALTWILASVAVAMAIDAQFFEDIPLN